MNYEKSEQLHKEALEHIVGGVNSPSRSFKAVGGGSPVVIDHAKGAYFWDVDGNQYIDYVAAYGPNIVGHGHPHVAEAVKHAAETGTLYGVPTKHEVTFAKMLKEAMPYLDKVRFTNSGTESVMTTIRVARAYTNRVKIVKFAGCYHGHSDLVLVAAGSGPATLGIPDSAGVPQSIAQEVLTVPFNDIEAFKKTMSKWGSEIAGVLVEPIVGNFGLVEPVEGFLKAVNDITHEHGALVIYDEVITGFRFTYGGVQDMYKIQPDLTALGKVIGGGLPIGAYGGKKEIMDTVAPLGPAYQAGTMAGNPISMQAGIACLEVMKQPGFYEQLDRLGKILGDGIAELAAKHGIPVTVARMKGMFCVYFTEYAGQEIKNYDDAQNTDGDKFAKFFKLLLSQGVMLAPSKYEDWFITISHTDEDIKKTLGAVDYAFGEMAR